MARKPNEAANVAATRPKKCTELHGDGKRIHVEQRQLRIELMDGLFHRRSHGTWIASRAQVNGDVVRGAVGLVIRQLDDRLGRRSE